MRHLQYVWRPTFAIATAVSFFVSTDVVAQSVYQWSGGAADGAWTSNSNWVGGTVPPTPLSGAVKFTTDGLGATNRLDQDRVITGTASHRNYGLHVNLNAPDGLPAHVIDLDGRKLTLNGGSLQVGYNTSNSVLTIRNGTLKLGDANAASVFIGYGDLLIPDFIGNALTIEDAVVDTTKCDSINVGRGINNSYSWHGTLDLRKSALIASGVENALTLVGDLQVGTGGASKKNPRTYGRLYLPAALEAINVRDFCVGYDWYNTGIIDFGVEAQLTNIIVRRNFYLSCGAGSGQGYLVNIPADVDFTIGQPGAPGVMWLAQHGGYDIVDNVTGIVSIVGGRFTAYLSDLSVGRHVGSNQGNSHGILDLEHAAVQIGGSAPDSIVLPLFMLGSKTVTLNSYGEASTDGLVRIPSSVTNLICGTLAIGFGANARGILDIGADSRLRTFTVTNGFYFGGGKAHIGHKYDGGWVDYLPTGICFTVGSADAPVKLFVGHRSAGHYPLYGETYLPHATLRITNGTVRADAIELSVGTKETSNKAITGVLDLRGAVVERFKVYGSAFIGAETNKIYGSESTSDNKNGKGLLYLRDMAGSVAESLYIGDTGADSLGMLRLERATLQIGKTVEINATGLLSNMVDGVSSGIDLTHEGGASLSIESGGLMHLEFVAPPNSRNDIYWGLRLRGDQRDLLQALVAEPARLTWGTVMLDQSVGRLVGIHYDANKDITFVGIDRQHGTLLIVQ